MSGNKLPARLRVGCNSFVLIDEATDRYLYAPESHLANDEAEEIARAIETRWNAHDDLVAVSAALVARYSGPGDDQDAECPLCGSIGRGDCETPECPVVLARAALAKAGRR